MASSIAVTTAGAALTSNVEANGKEIRTKAADTVYDDFSGTLAKWSITTTGAASGTIVGGKLKLELANNGETVKVISDASFIYYTDTPGSVSFTARCDSSGGVTYLNAAIGGPDYYTSVILSSDGKIYMYQDGRSRDTGKVWAQDTTYTITLTHDCGDNWRVYIDGGAFSDELLGTMGLSGETNRHLRFYAAVNAGYWDIDDVTYSKYATTGETATLAAIGGDQTYTPSTAILPAFSAGAALGEDSATFVLDYKIDSDPWEDNGGSHYTVDEFQALGDLDCDVALTFKMYFLPANEYTRIVMVPGWIDVSQYGPAGNTSIDLDGASMSGGLEETYQEGSDAAALQLTDEGAVYDGFTGANGSSPSGVIWATNMAGSGVIDIQNNTLHMAPDTDSRYNYCCTKTGQSISTSVGTSIYIKFKTSTTSGGNTNICLWSAAKTTRTNSTPGVLLWNGSLRIIAGTLLVTGQSYAADTWYTLRFAKIARSRTWTVSISGGAYGGTYTVLGDIAYDKRTTNEYADVFVCLWTYDAGVVLNFDFVEYGPAYSSSAETATLAAISGAATYDCSTLDFPAIIDGSRAAATATEFKVRYKVDGGAWTGYYTVAQFRALSDIVAATSLQFGLQIEGDGSQEIMVLRGQIDASVSGPAVTPGQTVLSVEYGGAGKADITVTQPTDSDVVEVYFRKIAGNWESPVYSIYDPNTTGTKSGLDRVLYQFLAIAKSSSQHTGTPSYPVNVFIGTTTSESILESIRDQLRTVGIVGVNNASIVATQDDLMDELEFPLVMVSGRNIKYETRNDGSYYCEMDVDIVVKFEGWDDEDSEDIFISGMNTVAEKIMQAFQPCWAPSNTLALDAQGGSEPIEIEGDTPMYIKALEFKVYYYMET